MLNVNVSLVLAINKTNQLRWPKQWGGGNNMGSSVCAFWAETCISSIMTFTLFSCTKPSQTYSFPVVRMSSKKQKWEKILPSRHSHLYRISAYFWGLFKRFHLNRLDHMPLLSSREISKEVLMFRLERLSIRHHPLGKCPPGEWLWRLTSI